MRKKERSGRTNLNLCWRFFETVFRFLALLSISVFSILFCFFISDQVVFFFRLCFAFSSRNFLLQHIAIWPVGYLWFSTMWGNYRLILEMRRKSDVFHGFSTFFVEVKERVHVCFHLSTVQPPRLDILGDNMFFIFIVQFIPCDQRIQLLQVSLKGCWCRYR